MSDKTQAEIFIQTLEEMRNHELQSRKARLRLQLKAHVRRFVEEFRTDLKGSPPPPAWSRRKTEPRHERP